MKLEMFQNDKIWQNMHIIHFFSYKHNIKKIKTFFFCRGSRFGIKGLKPDPDPEKFEYRIRIHIQAKNIYS